MEPSGGKSSGDTLSLSDFEADRSSSVSKWIQMLSPLPPILLSNSSLRYRYSPPPIGATKTNPIGLHPSVNVNTLCISPNRKSQESYRGKGNPMSSFWGMGLKGGEGVRVMHRFMKIHDRSYIYICIYRRLCIKYRLFILFSHVGFILSLRAAVLLLQRHPFVRNDCFGQTATRAHLILITFGIVGIRY